MRKLRIGLCALFFLLLTALRLLFPEQAELARRAVAGALDPRGGGRALAETLGRELGGGLRECLAAALSMAGESVL